MAMERTRAAKAENVILARRGEQTQGTLHLTPHHLIFQYSPPTTSPAAAAFSQQQPSTDQRAGSTPSARPRELWIGYPIIHTCVFRPSPTASRQPSSIRLRGRDFSFVCFYISDERRARDVYDSIRSWTCKIGRLDKLYAFSYTPAFPPEREFAAQPGGGGWSVYEPMREWRRQGVEGNKNWRVSKINRDYAFSETYPATFVVPSAISDNTLNYAGRYRSRARIPALTYLHPVNNCTISRSSQPMVGVRGNRSIQDEKLLAAIFNTTRAERPLSGITSIVAGGAPAALATPPPEKEEPTKDGTASPALPLSLEGEISNPEALEDAVIAKLREEGGLERDEEENDEKKPKIYGAQQRNMIIDARPTINAAAMKMVGMGSENMENYSFATKAYLGIDNIHVMRDSLQKVVDALKDSDLTPLGPNKEALNNSKWLKHIANMMDGVGLIVRQVGLQHSHVLIHCSDGWDRTSQLSALSQVCLDPYYRTLEGFIILVEKDWVSFGHRFRYRSGPLNSEKWFQVENERVGGRVEEDRDDGTQRDAGVRAAEALHGAQKSLGNALLSAKGWFKQNNDSRESLNVDSETEAGADTEAIRKISSSGGGKVDKHATKPNEVSPIFHQFLDATYQLMYQYPARFEFNERFLRRLLYHLYSSQYGTFLYDNEKERVDAKIGQKTKSVWDYFLSRKKEFTNPEYDPTIDDNVRGKERLIFPRTEEVRWWHGLFGRTDEEMNGGLRQAKVNGESDRESEMSSYGMQSQVSASVPASRARTPVLTGVETAEAAVGVAVPPKEVSEVKLDAEAEQSAPKVAEAMAEQLHAPVSVSPQETTEAQVSSGAAEPTQTQRSPSQPPPSAHSDKPEEKDSGPLIDSAYQQQQVQDEAMTALSDDLDPLGIGDVKDHVPQSDKAQQRLEKRRQQMEALLQ
ncbi:uncharacterized protein HMPREF1541_09342 [Cyphellophora europaea CBS 101466]|uniref:Myotubularin phosphatase domain-containing protein n=1 Tax=Cyphellophora europaea (strain CBS 101466) TaxID=1220924 RepID=W2SA53_CYPE1|nr:uncharacterized protein HMPREF1541_09342 [Cyphellophora europaea CBS 101466]ETN45510.1 hypothetical protein HMPREF1541_09342 [Cyphellophora europaea CBS 101466]